jgi:chromosome segregation ATPase
MLKKIGIASVVVVAGLVLFTTTSLGSYCKLAWKKARAGVSNQIPIEVEIERVRDEISQLGPDMNKNLNAIAQEMVAIENLREDIKQTRANLDGQKKNILTMREDLENVKDRSETKFIDYGGKRYSAEKVRAKLARDWESYKQAEASLKAKEELLEAKEQSLAAAREQINAMKAKKEQLEVQVAQLEAELKTLRVAEARGSFKIDDSRLAHIESSLGEIRNRVKVAQNESVLKGEFQNDMIPVEKKVQTADVLKEIDGHFGKAEKKELTAEK